MKILLKISYIGSGFCGFQCQKNALSVQEVLTDAAEKVFGEKCTVTGCSRTDSGVHAIGFCAAVEPVAKSEDFPKIPTAKIHRAFAKVLPPEISVRAAAKVPDDFHPRYSAKGKKYIYRIWDFPDENPFEKGRSMKCIFKIDGDKEEKMKEAAKYFEGCHDFTSFMASGSKIENAVRTVKSAEIYRETGGALVFSVSADGFLYNMVRIMAGTLAEVAAGRIQPQDVKEIIEKKDRSAAGVTAPPEGLYLESVFYDEEINWECS